MAEFVTRKEAQRRLWTVVVCAIFSVIALVIGLLNYKGAADEEKLDQSNSVAKLRKDVSALQEQNQAARGAYFNFSTPIGWAPDPRNPALRGDISLLRPSDAQSGLAGISPANLRKYLDTWVTDRFPQLDIKGYKAWEGAEGSGKQLTLVELWTRLTEKLKDLDSKIKALEAERDQNEKAGADFYNGTLEEDKRIIAELDQKNTGLRDSFTNKLTQLRNDEKRYRLELDGDGTPANKGLSGQVIELQMKLTELINEHLNLRVQLAQQRKELENRINWIIYRAEEARERKEPDGEILAVESAQGIGFIDLVHHDRIFRGGRFKVYSLEKGGEKRDKGEVEILEVAKERASKVAVYSTDLDNPIQPGDKIYNETYERGKARNIAIAGRLSGKLSNEDAIRRIKEFGDVYQERVTEKTNYLIVGEGYENDPNFALSKEYAVKIMIEKIFQEYLGVPQ